MYDARLIHLKGIFLFLFIPLVLYLFLRYPFGVLPSFLIAIFIMVAHRFVARPFFLRNSESRCFWCGRTGRPREAVQVNSGTQLTLELCTEECRNHALRFFQFASRHGIWLRIGIFFPLMWYIVTMLLTHFQIWSFPDEWNHFIFQFFIALTVVIVSFAYRLEQPATEPSFPFPIHNLFLIGARNTLIVFRLVGFWWLAEMIWFAITRVR